MPPKSKQKKNVFKGTKRRSEIIRYIKWFQDKEEYAPSMSEIAQHLKVSKSTVAYDMQKLKAQGRLDYKRYKARTIRLIENIP